MNFLIQETDILLKSGEKEPFTFYKGEKAPMLFELAALICETFEFAFPYMKGFFRMNYDTTDIADKCFQSILMHDFGENIIQHNWGNPEKITSLDALRKKILTAIETGKECPQRL